MGLRHDPIYAFASNPTITDDSNSGYEIGDDWKNTSTGELWMCMGNSVGAAEWKSLTSIVANPGGAKSMVASFASGSSKHVSTTSPTYESLAHVIFAGSIVVGQLLSINVNAWRTGGAPTPQIDIRVVNLGNADVICELLGVTSTDEFNVQDMGLLSNLPTGPTVFELQARRSGGATGYIGALELKY